MATAAEYEAQLNDIIQRIGSYGTANVNDITNDLMSRVDFFRPQSEEKRGIEAGAQSYLPQFMNDFYTKYGPGGGAGPGAFNMLNYGLSDVNRQMGTANAIGDVIGRAGGRIEDMARTGYNDFQAKMQADKDRYNMTLSLFDAQRQAEEAAAARNAAYGGYGYGDMFGGAGGNNAGDPEEIDVDENDFLAPATKAVQGGYGIGDAGRSRTYITGTPGGGLKGTVRSRLNQARGGLTAGGGAGVMGRVR